MKPQKRSYKTLRGPRGPRGEQGLSAYGVWLQAGNQGTVQDYLRAMQCARECLWMHNGGPVSYTHLDVYKRQAHYLSKRRFIAGYEYRTACYAIQIALTGIGRRVCTG